MVDINEYVKLSEGHKTEVDFKLATVTALFETGTAKIKFFGEEAASEKEYSYLASYNPAIDDIVLVVPFADTYIIAGKLLFKAVLPDGETVTMSDVNGAITTALTIYAKTSDLSAYAKTTDLAGYSTTSHTHSFVRSSIGQQAGLNYRYNDADCFVPSYSGMNIGHAGSYSWNTIYAQTGTINTSDRRRKKEIRNINTKFVNFFMKIKPIIFKFKKNQSGRDHVGFDAQNIEKIMEELNIDSKEFAGFIKTPIYDEDGKVINYEYALRYTEFIPINTFMIQRLVKRMEKAELKIKQQKEGMSLMKKQIKKLMKCIDDLSKKINGGEADDGTSNL
jgi:hypothetical protein